MIAVVWHFHVRSSAIGEFERVYGPAGEWAALFARSPGFLGVELHRDAELAGWYLVIDRWQSPAHREVFFGDLRDAYDELDRRCEELTLHEARLGSYEVVA